MQDEKYNCPRCSNRLSARIQSIAFEQGYEMPRGGYVTCESCGAEFYARLHWEMVLRNITYEEEFAEQGAQMTTETTDPSQNK